SHVGDGRGGDLWQWGRFLCLLEGAWFPAMSSGVMCHWQQHMAPPLLEILAFLTGAVLIAALAPQWTLLPLRRWTRTVHYHYAGILTCAVLLGAGAGWLTEGVIRVAALALLSVGVYLVVVRALAPTD